jgi:hypothetical protein
MWQKTYRVLLGFMVLAPLGCGRASGDQPGPVQYPFVLTDEELGLARELAEMDLPSGALPSGARIVFIKIDLLPDRQADTGQRLVMAHHYRYQTDETIFTMIDLHTREILNREIHAHYPTALAPMEVEHAIQLARADGSLRPLLDAIPTQFDARPIQYASSHERLFGHRVVHLLMRQGSNHLVSPRVLVDLTTETVNLEF